MTVTEELFDQIKQWDREIERLEDMREQAYIRIDQLQEVE